MLTLVQQHHLPHATLTTATWVQFLLSPYWRMIRNTKFFPSYLLLWRNTQWTTRNDVFNYAGYSSFLGFDTQRLGMVSCTPCFLFSLARFNNEFVSSPFHNRKNADGTSCGKLNRHVVSQCHIDERCYFNGKSQLLIMSHLSESYNRQVQVNTRALLAIIASSS